jgi:hypothetical protein
MGSVGDAYDNAMAESFFASLECELIDRRSFQTKAAARVALFTYIEGLVQPATVPLRTRPRVADQFRTGSCRREITSHPVSTPEPA